MIMLFHIIPTILNKTKQERSVYSQLAENDIQIGQFSKDCKIRRENIRKLGACVDEIHFVLPFLFCCTLISLERDREIGSRYCRTISGRLYSF